jgi:hypothetical protein
VVKAKPELAKVGPFKTVRCGDFATVTKVFRSDSNASTSMPVSAATASSSKSWKTDSAMDYIEVHAKGDKPFFMHVNVIKMRNMTNVAPEFRGKIGSPFEGNQ